MLLATLFSLLGLIFIIIGFIGLIRPSIFIKKAEVKFKRFKICASALFLCLISVILSGALAPSAPQNQQAQTAVSTDNSNPDIKFFKTATECIEDTKIFNIKDGTLKVISPSEFTLIFKVAPIKDPDYIKHELMHTTIFILLHTFAHTNINELKLHIKPEYTKAPHIKTQDNLTDLTPYELHLQAKKNDVLDFLQKYYNISSFEELTDTSDKIGESPAGTLKGTVPSDAFDKIMFPNSKDEMSKTWNLIHRFKTSPNKNH